MIEIKDLLARVVDILQDKKGEDIRVLPMESLFADYFVIVSALTSRHLWALSEAVRRACKALGIRPLVQGRREEPKWLIMDVGGIFIHFFAPDARKEYQLERLWSGQEAPYDGRFQEPPLGQAGGYDGSASLSDRS